MQSEGHDGIETMIQGVQERFPGYRFRRTGEVEAHNDRLRFTWDLAPEDGEPVVAGTDFGVIANGKLQAITGFFDRAPGA
jgi:hypothetical protein